MALSIGMVTIDCSEPQSLARFWTAALGTMVAGDYGEFVLLAGTPALGLQKVSEPRAGKNGCIWTCIPTTGRPRSPGSPH